MTGKKIILHTGPVRSGKTTTLLDWATNRVDTAGILTPDINGKRFFYSVPDKEFFKMEAEPTGENILSVGKFNFSATAFEKATGYLKEYLKNPLFKYLLIDEIGPLELIHKKGFCEILNVIAGDTYSKTIIAIVRDKMLEEAKEFFAKNIFDVQVVNREEWNRLEFL